MNVLICGGNSPSAISNQSILDPESPYKLRLGLTNPNDFVVITRRGWKILWSWYGGGPEITRCILSVNGKTELEAYPIEMTCYYKKSSAINYSLHTCLLQLPKRVGMVFRFMK